MAGDPGPPGAPTALSMALPKTAGPLQAGSWISSTRIELGFHGQGGTAHVTPQVEGEPSGTPFTGQPSSSGSPVSTSGAVHMVVTGLKDGKTYHWQAREVDGAGIDSAWTAFSPADASGPDFGVDQDPPARPIIHSSTNPSQNRWYNPRVVVLHWASHDALSGIKGYSYVLERRAHVIPPGSVFPGTMLRLPHLADGVWVLALRAMDNAGNWSPTATYRLLLDRQPARITWLSPTRFTLNPYKGPATVRFSVNKDAHLTIGLYRVGSYHPTQTYAFPHVLAGHAASITWSGKDSKGRPVSRGVYFFSATAIDRASNITRAALGSILVDPQQPSRSPSGQVLYPGDGKRIIVSLSRQTLYAYDGTRLLMQTFVTTGNPSLPTPAGSYTVMAKYHPFEFISPWPPGSPYWYPPSWSDYAMLFRDGGYFLHDAPWRSVFGPGSNGPGQTGTNYGGTHGCVNIPPGPMLFLWNWTPVGTRVDVVP